MQSSLAIPWTYGGCTFFLHYFPFQFFLSNFGSSERSLFSFFCRYQFVPQLIFLNSLFGYLSLLIIIKWCTGSKADFYNVIIYMFLSPTDDLGDNQSFWGQRPLQVWLYGSNLSFPNAKCSLASCFLLSSCLI